MPKNFPGSSFGPKVGGAVIEAAAERGQARSLAAMLAQTPLGGREQAVVEALAGPALRDAAGLYAAAGVDRFALEADFKALTAQLQQTDPAAHGSLLQGFDARWGKPLAQVRAVAGATAVAAPVPSADPPAHRDSFNQVFTAFYNDFQGAAGTVEGDFRIPAQSAWIAGSTRKAVGFGADCLLPAGLTDLDVQASVRLDRFIVANTAVVAGYASAGFAARLHARISAIHDSWHRDFAPTHEGGDYLYPGEVVLAAYTPVAGVGTYTYAGPRIQPIRMLSPLPEPTRLTLWIVVETWATAGGLANASVAEVSGKVEQLRVNGG